jgi:hypothetical protein
MGAVVTLHYRYLSCSLHHIIEEPGHFMHELLGLMDFKRKLFVVSLRRSPPLSML